MFQELEELKSVWGREGSEGGTGEAGSGSWMWTELPLWGQVPGPLGWPLVCSRFEDPFLLRRVSGKGRVFFLADEFFLQIGTSARWEFKFVSKTSAPALCCCWHIAHATRDSETFRQENNYLGKWKRSQTSERETGLSNTKRKYLKGKTDDQGYHIHGILLTRSSCLQPFFT